MTYHTTALTPGESKTKPVTTAAGDPQVKKVDPITETSRTFWEGNWGSSYRVYLDEKTGSETKATKCYFDVALSVQTMGHSVQRVH